MVDSHTDQSLGSLIIFSSQTTQGKQCGTAGQSVDTTSQQRGTGHRLQPNDRLSQCFLRDNTGRYSSGFLSPRSIPSSTAWIPSILLPWHVVRLISEAQWHPAPRWCSTPWMVVATCSVFASDAANDRVRAICIRFKLPRRSPICASISPPRD